MSDDEIQTLRSNFLIHWTGNDIDKKFNKNITDCEKRERREKYVDRLFETIIENETIENKIKANNDDKKIRGLWVNHQKIKVDGIEEFLWPAICFTEIKLSDSIKHAKRFGFLGFGFTREFVMERFGSPVLYVKGGKEKADDIIQANFSNLYNGLKRMRNESGCNCNYEVIDPLLSALISCLIYVKRMSDNDSERKFDLLDESEWRIPCDTEERYMNKVFGFQQYHKDKCKPAFVLPFCQEQLKVLIFPDEDTRKLALCKKMNEADILWNGYSKMERNFLLSLLLKNVCNSN